MTATTTLARPFVKWVGGKNKLLPELLARVPTEFNTYHEPFVGGGALFFSLSHKPARLTDRNRELITTYQVIQSQPDALIASLKQHVYEESYFYKIRELDRDPAAYAKLSAVEVASRFIYLNKTCYNGLYRVAGTGFFNVPLGRYENPTICDEENLWACHKALQGVELIINVFADVEAWAECGDFVYFDPPYLPVSKTASFTSYTQDGFSLEKHIELRDLCVRLGRRGVKTMVSNACLPATIDLYRNFNVEIVYAARSVNSSGSNRGKVPELIARNY